MHINCILLKFVIVFDTFCAQKPIHSILIDSLIEVAFLFWSPEVVAEHALPIIFEQYDRNRKW